MKKVNQSEIISFNELKIQQGRFLLESYFNTNKKAIINIYEKRAKKAKKKHFVLIMEKNTKVKGLSGATGINYETYVIPIDSTLIDVLSPLAKQIVLDSILKKEIVIVHASPDGIINTALFDIG
jgi:hypothetical protein